MASWLYPTTDDPGKLRLHEIRFTLLMLPVCLSPVLVATGPRWFFGEDSTLALPVAVLFSCVLFWVMYRLYLALRRAACLHAKLEKSVVTDELTGLGNRRAFNQQHPREARRAVRQDYPVSMLVIDLDFFKDVNDTFGHLEGDRILCCLADSLRHCTRGDMDSLFRIGGDEFVVILPTADDESSARIVGRIKDHYVQAASALVPDARHTLSIGCATYQKDEPPELWFNRADKAMYGEKRHHHGC